MRQSNRQMSEEFDSRERAIERAKQHGSESLRLRGTIDGRQVPEGELWVLVHSATALLSGSWEFYIARLDMRNGRPLGCGCQSVRRWCWHAGAASLKWMEITAAADERLAERASEVLAEVRAAVETTDANYVEHFQAEAAAQRRRAEPVSEAWV